MLIRTLTATVYRSLDESPSSVRELAPGPTAPRTVTTPTPRLRRNRLGRLVRRLAWLPFLVLAGALLLTGWMPALFVALVLLLPALAPFLLVLASVLASTAPR